ncbi:uncharacterized protein LOC100678238 [Nasonia vitripennis]|uniref:Putative odorant binding protein 41 n=1 Tax=Nasonia vitripennis TaxID=7425 RepID=G8B1P6_NASVI|nr:uncharacterized protein LOC100678238 [Nasonia vitripennis]CCD17810.1 putative odorant binding protein 41 [Nasonia vitripennis]
MKTFVFILLIVYVCQWSDARETDFEDLIFNDLMSMCLIENGFTNSTADVERMYAIGDPEQADKLKDVPKEKIVDVIVCLYHKLYPYRNLYPSLRQLIDRDDTVTVGQIRQMEHTMSDCYKEVGGKINNAELLKCVDITEPPFDHLFAAIRDVRQALQWCFVRCGVLISEMYTMEKNRDLPFKEYIKYIPHERISCLMACKAEQAVVNNSDQTLQKGLADLIKRSKNVDEIEKAEMLKSLKKCSKKVYGYEDEHYELVKCIDLFKPPFIDLF